jgi:hypothetical protein
MELLGRSTAQAVGKRLPTAATLVRVNKVALGHVFSDYFAFPPVNDSTDFSKLIIMHQPALVQ